jgi:hypothetical protein
MLLQVDVCSTFEIVSRLSTLHLCNPNATSANAGITSKKLTNKKRLTMKRNGSSAGHNNALGLPALKPLLAELLGQKRLPVNLVRLDAL